MKKPLKRIIFFTTYTTLILLCQGSYAASEKTFINPTQKDTVNKTYDYIFFGANEGHQYCKEKGYTHMKSSKSSQIETGDRIMCGEDESSYIGWNASQNIWEYRPTGSSNKYCYMLFKQITCEK